MKNSGLCLGYRFLQFTADDVELGIAELVDLIVRNIEDQHGVQNDHHDDRQRDRTNDPGSEFLFGFVREFVFALFEKQHTAE